MEQPLYWGGNGGIKAGVAEKDLLISSVTIGFINAK